MLEAVVVGDYLYIDGGENYTYDQATRTRGFTIRQFGRFLCIIISTHVLIGCCLGQSTLAVDLSTSWTSASVSATSHERPSHMKTSRRPLLWYDAKNNDVYEWSGWTYDGNTNENENWIWTFSPDGHGGSQWNQYPAPATKDSSLSTIFGPSTVYTPTAFYSLGGTLVPPVIQGLQYLVNTSIQGLLSFTFSDNTWTNTSSVGFAPSGFSVLGEACFVPNFGKEGLLIFLGGEYRLQTLRITIKTPLLWSIWQQYQCMTSIPALGIIKWRRVTCHLDVQACAQSGLQQRITAPLRCEYP